MKRHNFSGWSLEDWSLEHELLELRFHSWPTSEDVLKYEHDPQSYADTRYRGKGIFSRPTKILFLKFKSRSTVRSITINEEQGIDNSVYRFCLTEDSFVEVEAQSYVTYIW